MNVEPKPFMHLAVGLLGFCAGFADTAGYLGLDGLFTAHVTGNLVVIGARLAREQTEGAVLRVAALPVFAIAVSVAYAYSERRSQKTASPAAALLLAEGMLLGVASLAAWYLRGALASHDAGSIAVVGLVTIVAMGVQNATMRLAYPGQAPTTVMTGNVTQLVMDSTHVLSVQLRRRAPDGLADASTRLRKVGVVTLGFVVGAAAGAAITRAVGLVSLALPAAIVLSLGLRERSPAARPASGGP